MDLEGVSGRGWSVARKAVAKRGARMKMMLEGGHAGGRGQERLRCARDGDLRSGTSICGCLKNG